MSHFSVLVIGENPERQLAPYHEFECTGTNDQYVEDVNITAEVKARMTEENENLTEALSYWGLEDKIVGPALGPAGRTPRTISSSTMT
jgi:hypothetical protein